MHWMTRTVAAGAAATMSVWVGCGLLRAFGFGYYNTYLGQHLTFAAECFEGAVFATVQSVVAAVCVMRRTNPKDRIALTTSLVSVAIVVAHHAARTVDQYRLGARNDPLSGKMVESCTGVFTSNAVLVLGLVMTVWSVRARTTANFQGFPVEPETELRKVP